MERKWMRDRVGGRRREERITCSLFSPISLLPFLPCLFLQIVKVYITSRLESVEGVLRDDLEDPLDDDTALGQQLDQLSVIARYQ